MTFKNFRLQIICRSLIIGLALGGCIYFLSTGQTAYLIGLAMVGVIGIYNLIKYLEATQRKLAFFLESIENSDFTVKFSKDDKQGKGFQKLNHAFNQVLNSFREVRAEKEAHLQYLHTIVQYVRIGLISFEQNGKVGLINNAAVRLFGIGYIRHLSELKSTHHPLWELLTNIQPGETKLFSQTNANEEVQLSISANELRLRGDIFKLVAVTNIQSELQQKEVEAWQNLAKILRHEIMNSITPIVSHVETLNEMLDDEMSWTPDHKYLSVETADDLTDALKTIEKRSKGLLHFVDAYRSFSEIPTPSFENIKISDVFERLTRLFQGETKRLNISVETNINPKGLRVHADQELIDTVLINLFKNAMEALDKVTDPRIVLSARNNENNTTLIQVQDNGPGIIPEALSKIFVPFYTTKDNGSGIGLSLSRRIMQVHHGNLTVTSEPGNTLFTLHF